jgi:hypothetical protein
MLKSLGSNGRRLIYVTRGYQFPLGTTMSLARRACSCWSGRGSRGVRLSAVFVGHCVSEEQLVSQILKTMDISILSLLLSSGFFGRCALIFSELPV